MVRLLAFHESGDLLAIFEERCAKFYKLGTGQGGNSVKLIDAWEHPFDSRVTQVVRSPDESLILLTDKKGHVLVNRLTAWELVDQSRETRSAFHKRNDAIIHLKISRGLNLGQEHPTPNIGGNDA